MNSENWYLTVDQIETRDDFIEFVYKLKQDHITNEKDWESASIDEYLEAIASWTHDMDGAFKNKNQPVMEPSWRLFAKILAAASQYE